MNRTGLVLEDQVYDRGRFKKTGSHTCTKITPKLSPPPQELDIFGEKGGLYQYFLGTL